MRLLLPISRHRLLSAAAFFGLGAGCGGNDAGVQADSCALEVQSGEHGAGRVAQALVGGELDAQDPAVVAVNTLNVECMRAGAPLCTGTLVRPTVVLTAAHCVRDADPSSLGVLFGPVADLGRGPTGDGLDGRFFRVKAIRVHPDFRADGLVNDVAAIELETAAAVTPVPIASDPLDASGASGLAARAVGFGAAGQDSDAQKRTGKVAVTAVRDSEFTYVPDPAMTCGGDSGGPVLRARSDGAGEELVGVTSRGDASCREYGIAIRVDSLPSDFIERKSL